MMTPGWWRRHRANHARPQKRSPEGVVVKNGYVARGRSSASNRRDTARGQRR